MRRGYNSLLFDIIVLSIYRKGLNSVAHIKSMIFLSTFILCYSCSSTSNLETNAKVTVFELSNQYVKIKDLGPTPLELPKDQTSLRLSLSRENSPDEVAFILFPGKADGNIEIKLKEQKATIIESDIYQSYFDEILRIQRMIFRNDLKVAEDAIKRLESQYGETFSYYLLKGLNLGRMGKAREAKKYLQIAAGYNPNSEELKKYFDNSAN